MCNDIEKIAEDIILHLGSCKSAFSAISIERSSRSSERNNTRIFYWIMILMFLIWSENIGIAIIGTP